MPAQKPDVSTKNYLTLPAGEYPCGNNLYLIVADTGGRRWLFKYQRNGVKESMGFGAAKDVTFIEAKDKAVDARRLIAKGINPKEQRNEQRSAEGTELFGPFATAWKETMKSGLKHRASKAKLDRIVDVICLPLHRLPLSKISTTDVEKVLTSVWHLRETSRDTRQRIKVIFDAAIAKNLRTAANPADWDSRLKLIMAKQKKRGKVRGSHKGLPYDKLPALMQTLAGLNTQSARALETTILTLVRTIETMSMKWTQLDLDTGLWILNFDDTKNDRAKRTPLPRQTLAYLREAYKERFSDYVFHGRDLKGPMSNNTMLKMLKEATGDDSLTVHGFRTTFRSWVQDEETGIDRETAEHCMHHILGDEAEKAYKSGEALKKRRVAMQKFADFAAQIGVSRGRRIASSGMLASVSQRWHLTCSQP
jgi:integrase